MCRGEVKHWQLIKGSGTSSRSSVKIGVSGTSLSRFELENAGGGGYSPPILVGMCRGEVKHWQLIKGSGTSSRSSVKIGVSGTSLSRFELENAGHRNELDPFLAWKWESPELAGRVWLTRGAAERFAFRLSRCHRRGSPAASNLRVGVWCLYNRLDTKSRWPESPAAPNIRKVDSTWWKCPDAILWLNYHDYRTETFHAKSLAKICVRVVLLVLEFEDTINREN